ncbi:MAG: cell envelope integrity EipB family protein [Rhizobiaceae bacterium]
MRHLVVKAVATALLTSSVFTSTSAATMSILAPHRAVYDLELKDASDRSGIKGLRGRMVYEFNGSVCDGFTTTFRYVTKIDNGEAERLTDQQTTTFESADGKDFEFLTKNYVDKAIDKETRGKAHLGDTSLDVEVTKPLEAKHQLDKSFFPTTHLVDLLSRAESGEKFYEAKIFDGTEDADRTLTTTVILGDKNKSANIGDDQKAAEPLKNADYFPVSISYFDAESETGEETPVYQIGFKLYENGVTRDLVMDYGDFTLTGKLVDLKLYDKPDCSQ